MRASTFPVTIVLSTNYRKSKNFSFQVMNPHISSAALRGEGTSRERPTDEELFNFVFFTKLLLVTSSFLLEIEIDR